MREGRSESEAYAIINGAFSKKNGRKIMYADIKKSKAEIQRQIDRAIVDANNSRNNNFKSETDRLLGEILLELRKMNSNLERKD